MGPVRLFLALVVVADHSRDLFLRPRNVDISATLKLGMNAGYAVMFFFIISGFLMSLVLSRKYEATTSGTLQFYESRFVRIFSLYWPVAAAVLLFVPTSWAQFANAPVIDEICNIFLLGTDWRLAFTTYPVPYGGATIQSLIPAWTLAPELTFYALAPFLLRSWKLLLLALAVSVACRATFVFIYGHSDVWTYIFFPSTLVFFLLGHLARQAAVIQPLLARPACAPVLLGISIAAMAIGNPAEWDGARFWISAVCFAASLPSIFALSRNSRLSNWLADLSFPVYLVHFPIFFTLVTFLPGETILAFATGTLDISDGVAAYVVAGSLMTLILAVATGVFYLVERPTARAMRVVLDRLLPSTRAAAPAPGGLQAKG